MLPSVAAVMEDGNLASEILLRLPPQPSSIPRAAAVCKGLRNLASDPGFSRRFRRHHRHNRPLLGCFMIGDNELRFQPTLDPPNRVPQARFPFPIDARDLNFMVLGCRHGFLLMLRTSQGTLELLVWDPVNGHKHPLAIPPGLGEKSRIHGAVLRGAPGPGVGDMDRFQVVLVSTEVEQGVVARVYSSETGVWGNLIATPHPCPGGVIERRKPAVLFGGSLYMFLCNGTSSDIIEFDVDRQSLAVIPLPASLDSWSALNYSVMRAEGGGLGLLFVPTSGGSAQLWKREANNCQGVHSWVLARTLKLDKIVSSDIKIKWFLLIVGLAEESNVVFLRSYVCVFMLQLDSLQFKKVTKSSALHWHEWHPLETVYASGI